MRDLLLVTAFCDNERKLENLEKLLRFLQGRDFDILLSSHSIMPPYIQKMVDFFLFDKENLILSDDEIRYKLFFTNENFTINSNLVTPTSSIFAGRKLESIGMNFAKHLGYKKLHKVEYDLSIESFDEVIINSKLLDFYDVIYYTLDGSEHTFMPDSFWSINLNKIPNFYQTYIKEEKLDFFYTNSQFCSEDLIQNEFKTMNKKIKKVSELSDSKIFLSIEKRAQWFVPVFNPKTQSIFFFGYNETEVDKEIEIEIDSLKMSEKISPKVWKLLEITKDFSVKSLKIIVDNKQFIKINEPFNNLNFKKYNNIQFK